jgi:hypothetical protein
VLAAEHGQLAAANAKLAQTALSVSPPPSFWLWSGRGNLGDWASRPRSCRAICASLLDELGDADRRVVDVSSRCAAAAPKLAGGMSAEPVLGGSARDFGDAAIEASRDRG